MTSLHLQLPHRTSFIANSRNLEQTHDVNSPNDMIMDTDDYIGVANEPEKVAIINPDNLEQGEVDQLQDLPMANDRAYHLSQYSTTPYTRRILISAMLSFVGSFYTELYRLTVSCFQMKQ